MTEKPVDDPEDALRQALAELREAHRQKDELLSVISHELRNPLAPIHTAAALLERSGAVAEEHRRWLQVIRRQADNLTRLIDDLLDVSRLTRGTLELNVERVDLRDVIEAATGAAADVVASGKHTLTVGALPEELPAEVDPRRLEQLLRNLLVNAARYSPPGGRIEIRATRSLDRLRIEVEDTGVGLTASELQSVFLPFSRGEGSSARRVGGLGIGLSVARLLARQHGGDVFARSDGPGKGSTFVVELPAAVAKDALAV